MFARDLEVIEHGFAAGESITSTSVKTTLGF